MRIAYLGIKGLPSRTGAERVTEAIIRRLVGRHELTVYCDSRYTAGDCPIPGVRLIRIPTLAGKHLQPLSFFLLSSLHAVARGHYDLIHLHNVEASFVLPLLRLRYATVATAHGAPGRFVMTKWGAFDRALMRLTEYPFLWLSSLATSVSRSDVDYYGRCYGRRILYLPNGVDEQTGAPDGDEAILHDLGLTAGEYIAFAAARIMPLKGCHLLLQAFRELESDLRLVIVGELTQEPEYGKGLRALADARTAFIPPIAERERLFAVVRRCRLFVFPSTAEGMSMMLLEAASLGVPLICSDIEENKEVLGSDAIYFRSGDAGDLAAKMSWALEHPEEMSRLAAKAQTHVSREYSWSTIVEKYEELYRECGKHRVG